jgi:hypothetical protein
MIQSKRTESNVIYHITKMPTLPTLSTYREKPRSDDGQNPGSSDVGKPTGLPTGDNGQDCVQNDLRCRDVENVGTIANSEDNRDNDNNGSDGEASGSSRDTFCLPLDDRSTNAITLDGKDYVAFDLEWKDNDDDNSTPNYTIYAAAFVDNHGNHKVLHISDFGNSEADLLRAITDEILKYPASIGWYTRGIARRTRNSMGGASAAP